jgi:hypothetical protein
MKNFKILAILLFSSAISFYACNDTAKTAKQDSTESTNVIDAPTTPAAAPQTTTPPTPTNVEPAQNAAGVWHYTCSKGCAGGAGAAGPCGTCGGSLGHNTAYHAKANSAPTSSSPFATPPTATPPARTPEPSQNTAGVWHYTCGKGCSGGAGSASACGTCGTTLAHNQAYHQ